MVRDRIEPPFARGDVVKVVQNDLSPKYTVTGIVENHGRNEIDLSMHYDAILSQHGTGFRRCVPVGELRLSLTGE